MCRDGFRATCEECRREVTCRDDAPVCEECLGIDGPWVPEVVDLDSRRPDPGQYKVCACGHAYFRLVGARLSADSHVNGTTLVNQDNTLAGYSGILVCSACYRELDTGIRSIEPMPYESS